MAKTNQEDLNKFYQKIHEKTKNNKIEYILIRQLPFVFYQYPIDLLGEELKKNWIENAMYFFDEIFEKYEDEPESLRQIEEIIGKENYNNRFNNLLFNGNWEETGSRDEEPNALRIKSRDLKKAYEEGKLDKEAIMQIVNQELKKGNKISPPAILNLTQKEWDDFLFSNYGEKYKNEFFAITFKENPLFNTKIENVLKYISPSFDADDIAVIKDDGINKNQTARINEQKKLLLEVVEQLYVTGMLDKLFDDTSEKIEFVNSLLSKENKFEVVKKDEDKINYESSYNQLKNRIENLDIENQDDRIELIMLSRQLLNKYTKDIEGYEVNVLNMYINNEFLEQRTARIDKRKQEIETRIVETREQFIKEIEETLFNPDFIKDDDFLDKKGLSGLKKKIQNECKKKKNWVLPKNKNIEQHRKNIIFSIIKQYIVNAEYDGEKIPLVKDWKFNKELEKLKNEKNIPENISERLMELAGYIHGKDKTIENIAQRNENINDELYAVRNDYEKLPKGKGNNNDYESFSEFIDSYLKFYSKNPNGNVEDFFKEKFGNDNEYVSNLYRNVFESIHERLTKIKTIPFEVSTDLVISTMCKFLERKQKIYNLKSLNTVQLLKARENMIYILNDSSDNKAINIGIDGFIELFGTHFVESGPENGYIDNVSLSTEELNNSFNSSYGKGYIPLPRITEGQREEFKALFEYIKQMESKEHHDASLIEKADLSDAEKILLDKYLEKQKAIETIKDTKLTNAQKDAENEKINSYNVLKMQIALGAGIEYFRDEFVPKQESEVVKESDETSKQKEELEKALRENEELRCQLAEKETTIQLQSETISYFREKSNFMLDFIKTVKESKIGKIFFRNAIKRLPEATTKDEETKEDR